MIRKLRAHIVDHGLVSLIVAAFSIFMMRGFAWNLFFLFGFPTVSAYLIARSGKSPLAESFLISIGIASIIASLPWLFPRLGIHGALETSNYNNRLVALYLGIYLAWIFVVLPICLFGGSLRAQKRGEDSKYSSFTCYLGLFTASLFWIVILCTLPITIKDSGLWPVF